MKKVVMLLLLLAVGLLLNASLNQLRIVGKAEPKSNAIVQAQYQTVNRERAACLIFTTDLTVDLDFRPRIELVALTNPASGQHHVYVAPGERVVTVHALGYAPLTVVLRDLGISVLRSGEVYELKLTGDRPDVRSIDNINIVVSTNPRNATVFLNDNRIEDPRQILAKVGGNDLRIELSGYRTIYEEIEVNEHRTFFEYRMELEVNVPVEISTRPQGAVVYIDDLNMGTTPVRSFFPAGSHRIRIEIENYARKDDWIEIKEPHTVKVYELEDIRGTLTIKTAENSIVYINDTEFTEGVNSLKLAPQIVLVRIVTPKAEDIIRNVTIREKENLSLELFPEIKTGTVRVEVLPVNAEIKLTGDDGEIFSSSGSKTFDDIPIGMYQLVITVDDHSTHRESFALHEYDVVRKQIVLEEGSDGIELVLVEGGTFQMGSNAGSDDEKPVHQVTVSDFYIGKYEVTQRDYQAVMKTNPSHLKGDKLPVEGVVWFDAIEYCNKLSIKEGLTPIYSIGGSHSPPNWSSGTIIANWNADGYRLPTEAEWEYAAKGGNRSRGFTYSGSNTIGEVSWYDGNSSDKTHPVGQKIANELGIYDLTGNVWEWCWDRYGRDSYTSGAKTNPRGPTTGAWRVVRGGSWNAGYYGCRVAHRSQGLPTVIYGSVGLRVVRNIK